jgi:hypothetical protein
MANEAHIRYRTVLKCWLETIEGMLPNMVNNLSPAIVSDDLPREMSHSIFYTEKKLSLSGRENLID